MLKNNLALVLSILILAGCASRSQNPATVTAEVRSAPSETPVVSNEKMPSPTLSNTSQPKPIITLTPALTPTLLSSQEAYQSLQSIYKNNGGCQPPCYWGIVPGETSWSDAAAFLSPLGRIDGPRGTSKVAKYDISFERFDDPIGSIMPTFWVEKGIVKAIGINSSWVSQDFDYRLSGLLQLFGMPEEIWIRPIAESSDDQPYYYLILFYPSKGILVNLLGNAEMQGQYLKICPQDIFSRSSFPPQLLLWSPKEQVSFDSNFGKRLVDDDLGWIMDEYGLFQSVSVDELTNKDFYNVYKEPNTKSCLKVLPVR